MAQIVVFVFSVTLTLTFDMCSFFLSHALRMMYWNIHAKFHYNSNSLTKCSTNNNVLAAYPVAYPGGARGARGARAPPSKK